MVFRIVSEPVIPGDKINNLLGGLRITIQRVLTLTPALKITNFQGLSRSTKFGGGSRNCLQTQLTRSRCLCFANVPLELSVSMLVAIQLFMQIPL